MFFAWTAAMRSLLRLALVQWPKLRAKSGLGRWALALSVMAAPGTALAQQVHEPSGLPIPQPVRPEETNLVTGPGFPAASVTLNGLFAFRGENLDSVSDARTAPAVFSPLCGFTGTLVLRGGGCKVDFGWYNATQSGGSPPPDSEIYTLIPKEDPAVFDCSYQGAFCPLAVDPNAPTFPPGEKKWELKTFQADDIRNDPEGRYKGGLIGFALRGNSESCCSMTKFSQPELNQRCTAPVCQNQPWINALVYQSSRTPDAFYIAFEDLPTSPSQFDAPTVNTGGTCNGTFSNDGDFNDFVYFVTGLTCAGGGQPCDASLTNPDLRGACAAGRTDCGPQGEASICRPEVQPSPERCDNIDNDCNGVVDDGELCPTGEICVRGSCIHGCSGGEFPCSPGLACDPSGFCVDPACHGIECPPDQACRGGQCVGACDNVVCPRGQECRLGRCADPCAGVTCEEGRVCERGVCVSSCHCRSACPAGQLCAPDGQCVDEGCENKTCEPGQRCVAGDCVDPCLNALCPGGADCTNGVCGEPKPGVSSGGTGGADGGSGPIIGGTGGGAAGNGSGDPSGNDFGKAAPPEAGCACRAAGAASAPRGLGLLALLGLAGGWARRRFAGPR